MYAQIPRLLIECPSQLQTDFNAPDSCFETFSGVFCLKLLISPNEYKPVPSYSSGEPGYIRALNVPQYQVKAQVSAYEITVGDDRDFLFFIMQRISQLSTSNDKRTKTDVRVFDFVLPEAQDVATARAANTEAYTLRVGAFRTPEAQGGRVTMGNDRGWIKGGFSIKFEEKKQRIR